MVCNLLENLVSSVPVPKQLTIVNLRLGIFLKVMQVAAVVFAVISIYTGNEEDYALSAMDVTFWQETGGVAPAETPPHCNDVSRYLYNWSSSWMYKPYGCESVEPGEDYRKISSAEGRFSTYIKDTIKEKAYGAAGCSAAATRCSTLGGDFTPSPGPLRPCVCSKLQEYFVRNPEHNLFTFKHEYEVQDTHDGRSFQRGSSSAEYTTSDSRPGVKTPGQILTRVLKNDGKTPCVVGGRSEYLSGVDGDITASVEEWLACGELSLEDQSDINRGWGPEENQAPHLRITGALVTLELRYSNSHSLATKDIHTVCDVYVKVKPAWNSFQEIDHVEIVDTGDGRMAKQYRYRYGYGVSFRFIKGGSFAFFNPNRVLTTIVNTIVLFGIPIQIVTLIAMYGIGSLSKVYYNMANERFYIFKHMLAQSLRMIQANVSFRSLSGQMRTKSENLKDLSSCDVEDSLVESISAAIMAEPGSEHFHKGKEAAKNMAMVVASQLEGMDGQAGFSFNEYMRACSFGEPIDIEAAAAMFKPPKYPCLSLFDDSQRQIKAANRRGQAMNDQRASTIGQKEAWAINAVLDG